ncbi:hypothetical protein Aduo_006218 [Ancylostoma duodenale]
MCYATETWPDNEAIARSMRTTRRALERCRLKTNRHQQWHQCPRSSDLREKSRLKDPLKYMKHLKHRWAGHFLQRNDDRWSLRVTEWLPRNKTRPLGRLVYKVFFRKQGLPHRMQVARNRIMWKSCGP